MGRIRTLLLGNKAEDIDFLKKKYGQAPSKFISILNGVNLHFRDEGDTNSPVVILVHGHTEDLHTWNNMAKKLVEKF